MKPVQPGLSTKAYTEEGLLRGINREVLPVLQAVRTLANDMASAPEQVTTSTVDWSRRRFNALTLTASATLSFVSPPGADWLVLRVTQDATGGHGVIWPASVVWPSGAAPTVTVGAGAVDVIVFYCDGATFYGLAFQDFS